MFCPACGTKNDDDAIKCFICGKVMPGAFQTSAEPSRPSPSRRIAQVEKVDTTAALGDRMIAMVLDTLLLLVASVAIALLGADRWELIPRSLSSLTRVEVIVLLSGAAVLTFLYFWIWEGLFGATLGKSLVGIRVQRYDGLDVSLLEALGRTLLRPIDGLGFYFVGFVVAIFSKRRQRIGDYVSKTVVVNDPPTTPKRAGIFVLWLLLVAGPVFAVWRMVEPVRTWLQATVTKQTVEPPETPVVTEPAQLTLARFDWLESPEGPATDTHVFKPGDRSWVRYTLTGMGRNENGGINIVTESRAFDPNGLLIAKPSVSTTLELEPNRSLHQVDPLRIPYYSPPGEYELQLRVRDLSRGRDAEFVETFTVDAPAVEPASELEIRNFVFSIAKDGFPLDAAAFDVGETFHYRYEIHGLQFLDDRIDSKTLFRLKAPAGGKLSFKPVRGTIQETHQYHPPSFFATQSGSLSLPGDATPGIYTMEHVVTDNLSEASTTYTVQFRLR